VLQLLSIGGAIIYRAKAQAQQALRDIEGFFFAIKFSLKLVNSWHLFGTNHTLLQISSSNLCCLARLKPLRHPMCF